MKKKILIADDNPVVNKVLQLLLNPCYETIPAVNGKEAVEIATTQLPDLILMDILMPRMSGFQATRLIRQNPETRSIPIIALTSLDGRNYKEECLKSGCNHYIAKPFNAEDLVPCIENLLDQSST